MTGADLASAARMLVGAPFRLHGRDPSTGLDCLGVLAAACAACGCRARFPVCYTLRAVNPLPHAALVRELELRETSGAVEAGDVLLLRPGPCQHHLAIATGAGLFVHAHAGLRRVVEAPLPAAWPALARWRPVPAKDFTWQR